MRQFEGISASPGIAMGPVKRFIKEKIAINPNTISEQDVAQETAAAKNAFEQYRNELEHREGGSETEREVTSAHIELLSDPYFIDTVLQHVENDKYAADRAIDETAKDMAAMMESLDDPYLRERGADYRDIGMNILQRLKGIDAPNLAHLAESCIIVAEELTPSDTSLMDKEHVLGFANDLGGKTSHTSIIAQTLGIPCLVGLKTISSNVKDGDFAILDAEKGLLLLDPDEQTRKEYESKIAVEQEEKERLEKVRFEKGITTDGRDVEVATNIGNLNDLSLGLEAGAEGVGLFRTEFLYMDNTHFPTEEEQFTVYKEAAEMLGDKPLIIRTLDIGGDKSLPYYEFPKEENPFLGWRALRFCFDQEEIFRTQLRALLRASAFGNIKILLPMIISVDELQHTQKLIQEEKDKLTAESIAFNDSIDVGVMIETPASVFVSEDLAKYCDYFSIGTNDLTQYVLAADRGNDRIAHLYNTYNPAVLRAIGRVIQAAHDGGIWCGMCGGFAGDPNAVYLLLGLGLDEFSAPASKIGKLKDIIRNANYEEAKQFAQDVISSGTVEESMKKIEANPHK